MRQILLNSKGAILARMPRPSLEPGKIVVKVAYSMISVGTEIAGLIKPQEPSTPQNVITKTAQTSLKLSRYLGKAAINPRKALHRLKQMSSRQWQKLARSNVVEKEIEPLSWHKSSAKELVITDAGLHFLTDESDWGYQIMSNAVSVPEGFTPFIEISGTIDQGKIMLGVLNDDHSDWLGTQIIEGRCDECFTFPVGKNRKVTFVICNAQTGASKVHLDDIKVKLIADEKALPLNEVEQIGWNVGYSASGVVVAVADDITDIRPGDFVACAGAGIANHADYILVPRNLLCRVPEGCDLQEAASTTIGTIALQGVRRANPTLGERIAVLGLGLLGQMTVQLLKANGCDVIGMDLSEARLAKAKNFGLLAGASDAEKLKVLVRNFTQGHGVDRTIIAAATKSDAVINLAMEITRRKGTVVIVGDVGLNVERAHFYRKEIDLLMSSSYGPGRYDNDYEHDGQDYPFPYVRWTLNRNMQAFLQLIASQKINIKALIDKVIPVENAAETYQTLLQTGAEQPLGVLFKYSEEVIETLEKADSTVIHLRSYRKPRQETIHYALVGAGAFGTSMLVPQMDKMRSLFCLKGVVSRDSVRGGNFVRQRGVEIFASALEPILENKEIDLVVIATRHSDHALQVIASLRAGKHVFVEKPLALNWQQLENIVNCYRALPEPLPYLMVGFNRRFSPAMQALKAATHKHNSPLMMSYRLNGGYIPLEHWIQTADGGGRNIGEACHIYDCFRYLTGSPIVSIEANSIDPGQQAYLRNDNFIATLRYADGSVASLVYTALGPKQGLAKERLEVFCDGEAYILDDYKSVVRCSNNEVLWSGETNKGHFTELQSLGEAIRTNQNCPISFDEIVETTAVSLQVEDLLHGRDN